MTTINLQEITILGEIKDWFTGREQICWNTDNIQVYTYDDYVENLRKRVRMYRRDDLDFEEYFDYSEIVIDQYNLPNRRTIIVYKSKLGNLYELSEIGNVCPKWKNKIYKFFKKVACTSKLFIIQNNNI